MSSDESTSSLVLTTETGDGLVARRWKVLVASGPDRGKNVVREGGRLIVGTHESSDLVLSDETVSRHHVELHLHAEGVLAIDLGSKNGTFIGKTKIDRALITPGGSLRAGKTELQLLPQDQPIDLGIEGRERFGAFVTTSLPLKQLLLRLDRAARGEATVLLEGETGTGKELLARAIHDASPRREQPFMIVDCANVAESLLESELFGHMKGAFTGAVSDRAGAFESAQGGTVFLDELGELPLHLQPKLLRVIESRTIRRLGDTTDRPIDVRFVAATHRDLEAAVRSGAFRSDLYFRLAVVRAKIPPLRRRNEDVALLASALADKLSGGRVKIGPEALETLSRYDWPGNARELRNVVERAIALADRAVLTPDDLFPGTRPEAPPSYHRAREEMTAAFERRYVETLLARHPGNVSAAAREAGLSRNSLYALMKRVGLGPKE